MKLAFRVDASLQVGSGHLIRCLTLADCLQEQVSDIVFVCREHEGHLCGLVESKGYKVFRLPKAAEGGYSKQESAPFHAHWLGCDWQTDAEQTSKALSESESWDWLVVDHYALDARWESHLRLRVKKIFVIDDLADRRHDCDALLDQNLYHDMETRYKGLVPESCRQFLGPSFALLREEFTQARKTLQRETGEVKRILVFFGGVDSQNYTSLALESLAGLPLGDKQIDVVVGLSNPHQEEISRRCDAMDNTYLHVQASNMAELMAMADVAIGATGVSTWERCCLGLPTIALPIAENQKEIFQVAAENGLLFGVECNHITVEEFSRHIDVFFQNYLLRKHISIQSMAAVDGKGAQHIKSFLLK